jgi:hypothetical protein|nr:MAG TPA_asm: hypothetical protein [Bacteriophage sp.]
MVFFMSRGLPSNKTYDPVFANNDWASIIEACHANEVLDTWVADGTCYKDMDIGGKAYRIDIIGKNHDDLSDGTGKAPLTFQMHDCYDTTYQMNSSNTNAGGWRDCQMRTQTMPALKALLPAEVQSGIREVNKLTSAGNQSSIIVTTSDELFLLSEIEIFGSTTYSFAGEGTQYDYYRIGNRTAKNINGNLNAWWTRSPNATRSDIICLIGINGGIGGTNPIKSYGVPLCFCF